MAEDFSACQRTVPKERATKGFGELVADVVNPALCTICGACAGVCPRQVIEMKISDYESGEPVPEVVAQSHCNSCGVCYNTCPGKYVPLRDLDKFVFGRERDQSTEPLGIFRRCLRGYGMAPFRDLGSSGGVTLALISHGLASGLIDAAIIAIRDEQHPWRVKPGIITDPRELTKGVRSAMEAVPILALLHNAVVDRGFRHIGLVGLPCQIHAVRKLQMARRPRRLAEAVTLTIGLFCNSTTYFIGVEHLIKEIGGIDSLQSIVGLDYRAGAWPGSMMAMTDDGKIRTIATKGFYGSFFSSANYRRDRCLMCIDFAAELADVSTGDVFQNVGNDPRLTCVVTRTEVGDSLVDEAVRIGAVTLEEHDPALVPGSGFGWEMSKHACMYRWMKRREAGWPVPDYQYEPYIGMMVRKLLSARSRE